MKYVNKTVVLGGRQMCLICYITSEYVMKCYIYFVINIQTTYFCNHGISNPPFKINVPNVTMYKLSFFVGHLVQYFIVSPQKNLGIVIWGRCNIE